MVSLIRLIIRFIGFAAPWVFRAAVATLTTIAGMLVILWTGIPTALERIADEWTDRAVAAGFPPAHAPELHRAIQFVAFIMIVGAWIGLAHITVWLLGRVF